MGVAALQIFTLQRGFFQMMGFRDPHGDVLNFFHKSSNGSTGTAYDRVYNYLDHLWRASCVVPNPTVQYEPLTTLFEA